VADAQAVEPTLVTIGDIVVTQTWVVTPSGTRPRAEVSYAATPMYQTTRGIPTWAIVCAIVFFVFCLLGLLFLLVKEERTTGHLQVTAQARASCTPATSRSPRWHRCRT
jgi:hypothetical protein